MEQRKERVFDAEKRNLFCVLLSGISLAVSLSGIRTGLPFDAAWFAIVLCGVPIVAGAAAALVREHDIKADVMVSVALIASVGIGEYFAAGEVAFIMAIGTLLEDGTARKAKRGIDRLVRLTPKTARVRRGAEEKIIPAEEVEAGDTLVVLAGETVPADGVILSGETSIDQSAMTGESIPADKTAGDKVISGTVSRFGTFTMRATQNGRNSSLQRMVLLAKQADEQKAPIVHAADRWATWLVLMAFASAALCGLLTGKLIRAVTVLVVFCPCSFILATPTAVLAGLANAARHGILIRSGDALERFSHVTRIAFDKTGTLTGGRPAVTAVKVLDPSLDETELLSLTVSAELHSEHPLGKAVVRCGKSSGIAAEIPGDTKVLSGMGIEAMVCGKKILVGRRALLETCGIAVPPAEATGEREYLGRGCTVFFTAVDGRTGGFIALSDEPRGDADAMLRSLEKAGISLTLLTGDQEAAAACVGARLGIGDVEAGLLPEEKLERIRRLEERGDFVCMVGDGVNDSLALRRAHASIAMGGIGSDIAVESAGAVLVGDDVGRIPYLLGLSRRVMKRINGNIAFSMCWNVLAVVLSGLGVLTPVTGALVHNFGSVAVVVSSALLLAGRDRKRAE